MRSFPFDTTASTPIAYLITIQKALVTIQFTTWSQTITTADSRVFPAREGAAVTGLQFPSDGSAPCNADVLVMALDGDAYIAPGDAAAGLLDNWPITIEMIDPTNTAAGTVTPLAGTVGSVLEDTTGLVTIAANGPLRLAMEKPVCEHFSLTGREDLGDDRCKVPILAYADIAAGDIQRSTDYVTVDGADPDIGLLTVRSCYGRVRTGMAGTVDDYADVYYECTTAGTTDSTAPTYDPTVGNTTLDGTATFTARNAWTRHARAVATDAFNIVLSSLTEPRSSDSTWFVNGGLFIRSGPLSGFGRLPIRAWDPGTSTVTLFLPINPDDVPANTEVEVHAGCDLTREQCFARFDNIVNLRAETFVPPPDLSLSLSSL